MVHAIQWCPHPSRTHAAARSTDSTRSAAAGLSLDGTWQTIPLSTTGWSFHSSLPRVIAVSRDVPGALPGPSVLLAPCRGRVTALSSVTRLRGQVSKTAKCLKPLFCLLMEAFFSQGENIETKHIKPEFWGMEQRCGEWVTKVDDKRSHGPGPGPRAGCWLKA